MLPTVPLAFLILLSLLPGWIFIRLAERTGPRPERSQLAELLELTAVGLASLSVASLIVATASLGHNSGLFNVDAWARTRRGYLGNHLSAALLSVALALILSCLVAFLLWFIVHGRRPAQFRPGSSVWMDTLAHPPNNMASWVGVHCKDGSIVEGLLHSFTAGADDDTREISLKKPIRFTSESGKANDTNLDFVVVQAAEIRMVSVVHVPKQVEFDTTSSFPISPAPSS